MKLEYLFSLFIFFIFFFVSAQKKLFPIPENNLFGFIDVEGNVVIPPQFHSVNNFREGLAPVRINSSYGYIDEKGKVVIPYKFDYAKPFVNGIAIVKMDSLEYLIDKSGELLFENGFSSIYTTLCPTIFKVHVTFLNEFLINLKGDHISDSMEYFCSSQSGIIGKKTSPGDRFSSEFAVVDSSGKFTIPFGKFSSIVGFSNGFAIAEKIDSFPKSKLVKDKLLIDKWGRVLATFPHDQVEPFSINFLNENLFPVKIFFDKTDTLVISSITGKVLKTQFLRTYCGVSDTVGTILFSNREWQKMTPFQNGRAFVRFHDGKWKMIDNMGRYVTLDLYDEVYRLVFSEKVFYENRAFVSTQSDLQVLDANGKIIFSDKKKTGTENYKRKNDMILYEEYRTRLLGYWDLKNNFSTATKYQVIDDNGFSDNLMFVREQGRAGYLNSSGNYIWREIIGRKTQPLNIDYIHNVEYRASSKSKKDTINLPKPIDKAHKFEKGKLQIMWDEKADYYWENTCTGMKVFIANATQDTVYFPSYEKALEMTIQGFFRNKEWLRIQGSNGGRCGNGYDYKFLPPNTFWEFIVPQYEGGLKTKYRVQVYYYQTKPTARDQKYYQLHSEEIDGTINYGQFFRFPNSQTVGLPAGY